MIIGKNKSKKTQGGNGKSINKRDGGGDKSKQTQLIKSKYKLFLKYINNFTILLNIIYCIHYNGKIIHKLNLLSKLI